MAHEETKPYDAVIYAFLEWQASNWDSVQKITEFAKSSESELKKAVKFLANITSPQNQRDQEREILSAFENLRDPTWKEKMSGDMPDTAKLLVKLVKEKNTETMLLAMYTDLERYRNLQEKVRGLCINADEQQDEIDTREYLSVHQLVIENNQQFSATGLVCKATLYLRIMFLLFAKNNTLQDDDRLNENLTETEHANHELTSERIKVILEDIFENDFIKAEQLAKFWPSEIQNALFEEVMEIVDKLKSNLLGWVPHRLETVECLREMAEDLHIHNKNVAISQTVASSTSIVGTVLAIIGIGLTPVTFDASLGLTITGAALGGASAITHIGSSVTKHFIDKDKLKKLEELVEKEKEELEGTDDATRNRSLKERLFKLHAWVQANRLSASTNEPDDTSSNARRVAFPVAHSVFGITSSTLTTISAPLRVGMESTKLASRVTLGLGGALAVLTLPFDIADVVLLAEALKSGAKCATGEEFAKMADKFEAEVKSIQNLLEYHDADADLLVC